MYLKFDIAKYSSTERIQVPFGRAVIARVYAGEGDTRMGSMLGAVQNASFIAASMYSADQAAAARSIEKLNEEKTVNSSVTKDSLAKSSALEAAKNHMAMLVRGVSESEKLENSINNEKMRVFQQKHGISERDKQLVAGIAANSYNAGKALKSQDTESVTVDLKGKQLANWEKSIDKDDMRKELRNITQNRSDDTSKKSSLTEVFVAEARKSDEAAVIAQKQGPNLSDEFIKAANKDANVADQAARSELAAQSDNATATPGPQDKIADVPQVASVPTKADPNQTMSKRSPKPTRTRPTATRAKCSIRTPVKIAPQPPAYMRRIRFSSVFNPGFYRIFYTRNFL